MPGPSLPPLYLQGLTLKARQDVPTLNAYKLGLIEALLKETLRLVGDEEQLEPIRANLRTALDVALWEPPRARHAPPN